LYCAASNGKADEGLLRYSGLACGYFACLSIEHPTIDFLPDVSMINHAINELQEKTRQTTPKRSRQTGEDDSSGENSESRFSIESPADPTACDESTEGWLSSDPLMSCFFLDMDMGMDMDVECLPNSSGVDN
jgi:hypothetical protein